MQAFFYYKYRKLPKKLKNVIHIYPLISCINFGKINSTYLRDGLTEYSLN